MVTAVIITLMPQTFLVLFSRMGSAGVQIVCVALGVIGLIGVVVCCAVPRWKVSSFTGANIVTAQVMKTSNLLL